MKTRKIPLLLFTMIIFTHTVPLYTKTPSKNTKITAHNVVRTRKGTHTESHKKTTSIKQMDYEELSTALNQAIEKKSYSAALKYLERLINITHDPVVIADLLFLMGTIYFDTGDFAKAVIVFDDFKTKFKAHKSIETAYYKSTLGSFYLTLDADRDQTQTHQTIQRADAYLDPHNNFEQFSQEVRILKTNCMRKIADHELQVCDTLLRYRKNRYGVEARLAHLQATLLPHMPEIGPQILAFQEKIGIFSPAPFSLQSTAEPSIVLAQK